MKRLAVLAAGAVAMLILAGGAIRVCREVRVLFGGYVMWSDDAMVVVVTSQTLTYKGSCLWHLKIMLSQISGVATPSSSSDAQTYTTIASEARTISQQQTLDVSGITIVDGKIVGWTSQGAAVTLNLNTGLWVGSDALQRTAYLQARRAKKPFVGWSEASIPVDQRLLIHTKKMDFVVSRRSFEDRQIYEIGAKDHSTVVADILQGPRWVHCGD